jgi:hypothetical protein
MTTPWCQGEARPHKVEATSGTRRQGSKRQL